MDPNFIIEPVKRGEIPRAVDRKVLVFGIPLYAVKQVEAEKLLHAANIMAQYLDNDEDGEADNPLILKSMQESNAFMILWKKSSDQIRVALGSFFTSANIFRGQDLGNDETIPAWHKDHTGYFDATLEEIFHLITNQGYARVYPEALDTKQGSQLSQAMDKARGGYFRSPPKVYPEGAWFTYEDKTCSYNCMLSEYLYWAQTTLLGAQEKRAGEIGHEWHIFTKEQLKERDPLVYNLLTHPKYKFPSVLPDGTYRR